MSKYYPQPEHFFYVKCNPRVKVLHGDLGGGDKTITVQDGSYKEDIFQCTATDDTHIVCNRVFGGFSNKQPKLFCKDDYTFAPVGPTVLASLQSEFVTASKD